MWWPRPEQHYSCDEDWLNAVPVPSLFEPGLSAAESTSSPSTPSPSRSRRLRKARTNNRLWKKLRESSEDEIESEVLNSKPLRITGGGQSQDYSPAKHPVQSVVPPPAGQGAVDDLSQDALKDVREPIESLSPETPKSSWIFAEPKRPPSAYLLYVRDNKDNIDAGSPSEKCSYLNRGWQNLEGDTRQKYVAEASSLHEVYMVQHAEFQEFGRYSFKPVLGKTIVWYNRSSTTGGFVEAAVASSSLRAPSSTDRWSQDEALKWLSTTLDKALQAEVHNRSDIMRCSWDENKHHLDPEIHEPLKTLIFQKLNIQL